MSIGVIREDFKEDVVFELVLKLLLGFGWAEIRGTIFQMRRTP